jgi:nucleoside-diphosphate-sugar epimerase
MERKIFITGSSGMVGFHAVKYFVEQGYHVIALIRSNSKRYMLESLLSPNLSIVEGSIENKNFLKQVMIGCFAVIHCAGSVDPHARREDIFKTNVEGTKNCIEAAISAGVKQFIHISSLSVVTGQKDQFQVNETAPLKYCGESYADSKVEAEKLIMEKSKHQGQENMTEITILRPGFIYGPMEKAWMPKLIASLQSGKAMLIDGGYRQTNVIYVGNLCKAMELCLGNDRAYGQVYNLTDGNVPSKKELFDAICDGLYLPRVQKSIPRPIVYLVCETVSLIAPLLPENVRKKMSRFSRAAFRLAGVNQGFDISKAVDELDYTNRVAFHDGMHETLKWFSSQENIHAKEKMTSPV